MSLLDLFRRKATVERLADGIVAAAAAAGETGWRLEPSARTLVREGTDGVLHLDNIFLEYSQAARSRRRALLDKYVALLVSLRTEIPKLWPTAEKSIYAVIRSRNDAIGVDIANRAMGGRTPARIEYPWHGELVVRIAYDFGASLGQVQQDVADAWGRQNDALLERAIRNLCALPRPEWEPRAPGVFQLVSAASYEESMLLRNDVWERLEVAGDAVAITPNRGVLLAAGSADPGGVEALLDEARRSFQQRPWPIDATILRRRDRRWSPYEPSGRAAALWALHRQICVAGAYSEQQAALQEHVGSDVWVATFGLAGKKNDPAQLFSYAVWTEGVPTLLPEVEYLAVRKRQADDEFDTAFVPWAEAHRVCGAHLRIARERPLRWAVDSFPSAAEWRALMGARVEP